MERTFEEVYRELAQVHNRETKELKDKTDSWRERFEKLKAQKQKCQEEYHAQREENRRLSKEVVSLLDTISKLHSREVNVKCTMCETLQKSLDTLSQSYNDSLAEKDRIISILDAKLAETSGGESFLPKIKLRYSTPSKRDRAKSGSLPDRPPSNKKQSPDSTIRTTPGKDGDKTGNLNTTGQSKGTKLCLSRGQKRHRYTETNSSPDKKRQKKVEKMNEKKGNKQVLVPETCDLYNQSNVSSGSDVISLDDSLQSPVIYRSKDQQQKNDATDKMDDVCAADVQIIPETVNFFDAYPSSSSEEEEDCTQSTIKRAPSQNYSLRSVLCSPQSSDDEDGFVDMRNVVNHRTMHLSGQSVVTDVEDDVRCSRNIKHSESTKTVMNDVNQNDRLVSKMIQKKDELSKQKNTMSVKPYQNGISQTSQRKSQNRTINMSDSRQISNKTSPSVQRSPTVLFPVTKTGRVRPDHTEIGSPSILQGSSTEVRRESESPSLLNASNTQDVDITILDSPVSVVPEKKIKNTDEISNKSKNDKQKHGEVDEDESPCILRSKARINDKSPKKKARINDKSPKKKARINDQSPKKKTLKLSKGSKVELVSRKDVSLSPRQLRQTTLSQVFNNSPPKRKKKKSDSQEEEDLQKAIQLSLRDAELMSIHRTRTDDVEESVEETVTENTPPFKKPVNPAKKSRNRHPSSDSPLKSTGSTRNESSVIKGQKSPRKQSTILQSQRSPGNRSSVQVQRSPGKSSPVQQCQNSKSLDLDETLSPDLVRMQKSSRNRTSVRNRTSPCDDGDLCRNGSIDPDVHLSVLCDEESEAILENHRIPTRKKLSFNRHDDTRRKESASMDFDVDDMNVPSLDDSVATLKDFRIDDLERSDKDQRRLTSTCIDEDSQSIPCSSRSVKFGSRKKRVIVTSGYNSQEENDAAKFSEEQQDGAEMDDSFDKLPDKAGPKFAYVGVVRKQNERRNLIGYECKECLEYYSAMGLSEDEIRQRVQTCSKHRAHYVPPETPPHFWSIGFPDTQECEERGYLTKEENMDKNDIRPAFRRRRKLKKIFKSKNESDEEEEIDLEG
ncbi:DNA endonuclease RBBP8-like isoform X1 [Argopecten irradians]|uniref:DNA endonuclease RBBP8-like isoform X1 n=1 Tax=Argopecten irradians TaxID=31199 RepID=UPI003721F8CC